MSFGSLRFVPINEMCDTYIYKDKTFVERFWINPENIYGDKTFVERL
jgi:hypothetical protein